MSKLKRVFLESGSHSLDNLGDLAMLKVAADRIFELSPECRIQVVTRRPDKLAAHVPRVEPVGLPLTAWQLRLGRQSARIPSSLRRTAADLLRSIFLRAWPSRLPQALRTSISEADLVLLCGSGILADPFSRPALRRLAVLERAQRIGIPTALLGQGLGPLTHAAVIRAATGVLPQSGLIGLRERLRGPTILAKMQVPGERVMITGDDSLALAYPADNPQATGKSLGLNMRLAEYSGVDNSSMELLSSLETALHRFCDARSIGVVPIATHRADDRRLRAALPELASHPIEAPHDFNLPSVMGAISRCRVVIAGSYHAAVFALGQGIPALCVANSQYYRWKFDGLADLFPEACAVVDLSRRDPAAALIRELGRQWEMAPDARSDLLLAAAKQIEWSKAAYRRLAGMV